MKSKTTSKSSAKGSKTGTLRKVRGKARVSTEAYKSYDEGKTRSFDKEISQRYRFLVGVDEAGRGPLAGPVAVGMAVVPVGFNWRLIRGVGDSKKVPEKNREAIFLRAQSLKREGEINFHVALIDSKIIDKKGITHAVSLGITTCLKKLKLNPKKVDVRLDGLLKAPPEYRYQTTIIKGDAKEKVIGLASIMAKVTRDRYMRRIAGKYPQYGLEAHKGYGTKGHREALKIHGVSPVHRKTFCKSFCV